MNKIKAKKKEENTTKNNERKTILCLTTHRSAKYRRKHIRAATGENYERRQSPAGTLAANKSQQQQ